MALLDFGDEGARRIQRIYSTPNMVRQRSEVLHLLAPRPGERVLDVGSGPGYLVAALADAAGPDGAVHGLDSSAAMNLVAERSIQGRPWARIDEGDALRLPFAESAFDAATVLQVYEYVDDVPAALAELHRVLRPGGRVVVLDTDWDSIVWHAADVERHRRVMTAWGEHLVHPHLPRVLAGHLRRAGFRVVDRTVVPIFDSVYHADAFSAGMMEVIGDFVVGRQGLSREDVAAWSADLVARGAEDDYLFSLNRYCFAATAE